LMRASSLNGASADSSGVHICRSSFMGELYADFACAANTSIRFAGARANTRRHAPLHDEAAAVRVEREVPPVEQPCERTKNRQAAVCLALWCDRCLLAHQILDAEDHFPADRVAANLHDGCRAWTSVTNRVGYDFAEKHADAAAHRAGELDVCRPVDAHVEHRMRR